MNKRPLSIAIIGGLFIVVGTLSVARGLWPLINGGASRAGAEVKPEPLIDSFYASSTGVVAAVGGAYLLRGSGWARWLLVAWMAFHIVMSLFHSLSELAIHCVLFGVIIWLLIRPPASAYLRSAKERSL